MNSGSQKVIEVGIQENEECPTEDRVLEGEYVAREERHPNDVVTALFLS